MVFGTLYVTVTIGETPTVEPAGEPVPTCEHCGVQMGTSKYPFCSPGCSTEHERERLRQQVALGTLRIRQASPLELERLRADAEAFRAEHPEFADKVAKLRPPTQRWKHEKSQPKPTRECPQCGGTFTPRDRRGQFCSRRCASDARRKLDEAKPKPKPKVKADLPVASCEHCGEPFRPKRSLQRFCGKSCGGKAKGGRKATVVQITCQECGEVFEQPPKRAHRTYCSRSCSIRARHAAKRAA